MKFLEMLRRLNFRPNNRKLSGDLIPFEADNNIGTIQVGADGSLHPWYSKNLAKGDMTSSDDSTLMLTPNPMESDAPSDDDHKNFPSDFIFNGTSFDFPHHSYYPHAFYDEHHDDHHHYHETTTTTTTEAPVKSKPMYAHYQLRLKFWYANLAFAIWFIFYCVYLMVKSLGRHKTRFPNHATLRKREIEDLIQIKDDKIDLVYQIYEKNIRLWHKTLVERQKPIAIILNLPTNSLEHRCLKILKI
uniref:CSON001846 protein n=1 Tax=Culicoides sonorensis TaxID=179676 RepID=A0A336KZH8_CULSO